MRPLWLLVFATGCMVPVSIADKDDTDIATNDTDLVADTDTDVIDTDVPRCRVPIVIHNSGTETLDSYAVHVDVTPFDGLAADLSNLVFGDAAETRQYHWVDSAVGGSGTAWVRVDLLPPGDTTIYADACDPARDDVGDPKRVFPVWETWDGTAITPWTAACENIDAGEHCTAELGTTDGGVTGLHLTAISSCYAGPYNGARSAVGRQVTLPVGTWELSYSSLLSGTHDAYCDGSTSANTNAYSAGTSITDHACGISACGTCALPWTAVTSTLITGDSGPTSIVLTSASGDCASVDAWIDDVWVHQVATPAPTVDFNP